MKKILLSLLIISSIINASSQSLRSGYLKFTHVSGFTFSFTADIYSNDSSVSFIVVTLGDGTNDTIENNGVPQIGSICYSEFSFGNHTYPGEGTYLISVSAHYLMDGIANIPSSSQQSLYIEDTLRVLDPAFYGYDNSPVILIPLTDTATTQQPYVFNPNAYDPDGDSLAFLLVPYLANDYFTPPATNSITIDGFTGELVWNMPEAEGNYALAILIREYRLGALIGTEYVPLMITVVNLTSTNSISDEANLSIFPNPATDILTFDLSNFPNEKFSLTIFNSSGQQVMNESNLHSSQLKISVAQLGTDGLYFYSLNYDEKKFFTGKFLVQR